jgi:glycosyltransferase involved in cell wall biosynthesis
MARALDLGGSERQMTETAKSLDRARFEPHVGCFRPEGVRGDELRVAGVPVVQFPVYSYWSPAAARGVIQLARYIRRHNIRLVHTWDYPLEVFAVPVTRMLTNAIAVSSQRGHRSLTPGLYKRLQYVSDRMANAIVVNCEFLRKHLEEDEKISPGLIRVCHNGIDLEKFSLRPGPRVERLAGTSLVIGTVCVLRAEKDLPTLLRAFASIRLMLPGMKLAVVGSGPELEKLEALSRSLDIANDCIFEPGTKHVPQWLRSFDIFVLPSLTEALSNSLMEAMACGCTVVASNVGGNPELVMDGETGILFRAGDVDGLAEALNGLIANQELRHRFSAAARERICQSFSTARSAARMGEIYEELIRRRLSAG